MTQKDSNESEDLLSKALVTNGSQPSLELSKLTEEEQKEIAKQYQTGLINIRHKADELRVDIGALSATLDSLSDAVSEINAQGNSATISHTQDSSAGRTEILIGNTGRAASGKFTKSQTGERDWTPIYIGVGAVIAIVALIIITSG
jgi:hypothetical protein